MSHFEIPNSLALTTASRARGVWRWATLILTAFIVGSQKDGVLTDGALTSARKFRFLHSLSLTEFGRVLGYLGHGRNYALWEIPMPKGPKGVKRPADTNSAAVMVGRIATGEIEDKPSKAPGRAIGGKAGGIARAIKLSPETKSNIAKNAAKTRWKD